MTRLTWQVGQAAEQAARHQENNAFIDLEKAIQAATKFAVRRFARRELRPIFKQDS